MNLSKDKHTCPICLQPNKTARELYIHLGFCHYGSVTTLNIPEEVNNQNEHRFRCDVCVLGGSTAYVNYTDTKEVTLIK